MSVERLLRIPISIVRTVVPDVLRRSYALKFGVAILLVALVVGVTGAVATTQFAGVTQETAGENYAATASQEAQWVEEWESQRRVHLEVIAASTAATGEQVDSAELSRFADTFRGDQNTLEAIHVVDNDGQVLGSSAPGASGQFTSDEAPWVDRLGPDAPIAMQRSAVYEQDGNRMIAYLRPIGGADRWVVATYDVGRFADTLSGRNMPGDSFTVVVDRSQDDTIIAHGRDDSRIGTQYGEQSLLAESDELQIGDRRYADNVGPIEGLTDEQTVVGMSRVGDSDLIVFVHGPTDDAYGMANTVEQWGLIATLLGVLLIGGVGALLGLSTSRSIDRLTEKAEQMKQGDLNVEFETGRVDNIGQLYVGFAAMRDALRDQIQEADRARQNAEDERERVQRLNDELEAAAGEYSEVMSAAADGDLTVRADVKTDHESMDTIGESFNEMLDEIEATVEGLKQFASEVATASEEVTASSEEVRSASEQVSESVQEISDGAKRQNESLQSVNEEMENLSTTTEEIAASSNQVADTAQRTVETGQEGREAAEQAIAGINQVEDGASRAVEEIEALEREVEQIDDLIASIAEIADQTNMLALNANIEASRSGGGDADGEGFDVVAQEVKALSEDTKEAAEEIENRLERIRAQTDESASEVQATRDTITEQVAVVKTTVAALDEIASYAEETNTGVQEISAATEEQASSTEEVVAMIDEAATISEETTSEAENVAAAAEEQTTAMTEVSQSASDLTDQAAQLSEALNRFDTNGGYAPGATPTGTLSGTDSTDAMTGDEPIESQPDHGDGADHSDADGKAFVEESSEQTEDASAEEFQWGEE